MNYDEARKFARSLGFISLKGTLAEVRQAEIIRAEKLAEVPFFQEGWEERDWGLFIAIVEAKTLPDNVLFLVKHADDARFWLENQDFGFWEILEWL
jgi:hypothetical protein